MSDRKMDGLAVAGIAVAVVLFFGSVWLLKGPYFVHDIVTVMAPLEELFGRIQRAGESPLWSPEIHGGYPLLAFGQLGYFYPLHMVLRQYLSGVWVVNVSLAGHVLLGAWGMFAWLRAQGRSALSSAVIGLVFVFGGAVAARFAHIGMVLPLTWLPWATLALDRVVRARTQAVSWVVLWVGANVGMGMVGHPQSALMGIVVQAVWLAVLFGRRRVGRRQLAWLALGSLLVGGLLLPTVLPILEAVPHTDRAVGLPETELFEFSGPPAALAGLVVPHPFGRGETYAGPKGEAELALYVGPVLVVLAGAAIVMMLRGRRRSPMVVAGSMLLLLGMALGLGEHSWLYRWLIYATPQHFFSVPVRYFLLLHIGVLLLAAWGFDQLPRRWRGVVAVLAVVPVLVVAWDWERELPPWSAADVPAAAEYLRAQPDGGRVWAEAQLGDVAPGDNFGITVGEPIDTTRRYRQTLTTPFPDIAGVEVRLALRQTITPGVLTVTVKTATGETLREVQLSGEALVDSELTSVAWEPLTLESGTALTIELSSTWPTKEAPRLFIHTNPPPLDFDPTGVLSLCREDQCLPVRTDAGAVDGAIQVVAAAPAAVLAHEALLPHIAAGFGIPSGQWTGALPLVPVNHYLAMVPASRTLFDRLGITRQIGWMPPYRTLPTEMGWREEIAFPAANGFIRVMQNQQAWPRFQFASHVEAAGQPTAQQTALLSLPPGSTTVVSDVAFNGLGRTEGDIVVRQDARTSLALTTTRATPGFLVVRDLLWPGWKVTIDGQPAPMHPTDVLWRGVLVPAGEHELIFRYQPGWISWALAGSALALLGVWGVVGAEWHLARQQRLQGGKAIAN